MRVTVVGLNHLGTVNAACLSRYHEVTGIELGDSDNLWRLRANAATYDEPGLGLLMETQKAKKKLFWSANYVAVLTLHTDILWVCHDAKVSPEGKGDISHVLSDIEECLKYLPEGRLVVISAQVPVGTGDRLQLEYPGHRFAILPENLRRGQALKCFDEVERVVVGCEHRDEPEIRQMFWFQEEKILAMGLKEAEMTKHVLNAYLALCITFGNEVGRLCGKLGVNPHEVFMGITSEKRVSSHAPLKPGNPFSGHTLIRDTTTLCDLGEDCGLKLIPAIKPSNDTHASLQGVQVSYLKA